MFNVQVQLYHAKFFLLKKSSTPLAMFGPRILLTSLSLALEIFFKESNVVNSFRDFISPNPGTLVTDNKMSL